MKKGIAVLVLMLALGLFAASALGSSKRVSNFGGATVACNTATKVKFTNFPNNGHGNTVSYVVKKNGSTVDSQTKTFTGATSPEYTSVVGTTGSWVVSWSWNTNGVSGSDSTSVTLNCTSTITTTTPNTTTAPTASTVTQTTPAPPAQTVTVTLPAPQAVTVTVTTPAPPAKVIIKTVTKWKKCPPVKKPKPKTLKQKCLAGKNNTAKWVNGHCEFGGQG